MDPHATVPVPTASTRLHGSSQAGRATPPARVGDPVDAIDTPALLIDMDAFERNIVQMRDAAAALGVALRPHAKTHKCATIAKLQMAAGAVGVCVQKVAEAEALAAAGVPDLYVSNEVAGDAKLERLARLAASGTRIAVAADCAAGVEALARAAARVGARLRVLVEIDVGQGRCGTEPGAAAAALAQQIADSALLEFAGLQAYHGSAQHFRSTDERRHAVLRAAGHVADTHAALAARGLPCAWVTGAGTGTFMLEGASGAWNEIQPGSYVFMDADYARNAPQPDAPRFEQSLWVLATVMSRRSTPPEHAVVDAGLKAYSVDSGLPEAAAPGWRMDKASDEHGVLVPNRSAPTAALHWGQRVRLLPGHCDPTVNLHDWYVAVRGERVEAVWPIEARGAAR